MIETANLVYINVHFSKFILADADFSNFNYPRVWTITFQPLKSGDSLSGIRFYRFAVLRGAVTIGADFRSFL